MKFYCSTCNKEVEATEKEIERTFYVGPQKEPVKAKVNVLFCSKCGNEICNLEHMASQLAKVYAIYNTMY